MPTLLALIHASWERPHRILDAFGDETEVLDGRSARRRAAPRTTTEVDGVVAMGGPMSVDDLERYPALADEREWLAEAVRARDAGARDLPRRPAPGARPGRRGEAGGEPGDRLRRRSRSRDPHDPIVGALAPETTVFHWHGDVFDLPEGAVSLASSAKTEHQAFRYGNAWGVLFHPEADAALVEAWMEVPEMVMEAGRAIGLGAAGLLPSQAEELEAGAGAPHRPRASAPSPSWSSLQNEAR